MTSFPKNRLIQPPKSDRPRQRRERDFKPGAKEYERLAKTNKDGSTNKSLENNTSNLNKKTKRTGIDILELRIKRFEDRPDGYFSDDFSDASDVSSFVSEDVHRFDSKKKLFSSFPIVEKRSSIHQPEIKILDPSKTIDLQSKNKQGDAHFKRAANKGSLVHKIERSRSIHERFSQQQDFESSGEQCRQRPEKALLKSAQNLKYNEKHNIKKAFKKNVLGARSTSAIEKRIKNILSKNHYQTFEDDSSVSSTPFTAAQTSSVLNKLKQDSRNVSSTPAENYKISKRHDLTTSVSVKNGAKTNIISGSKTIETFEDSNIKSLTSSSSQAENSPIECAEKFIVNFDGNNNYFEENKKTFETHKVSEDSATDLSHFIANFDEKNNILDQKNVEIFIQETKGEKSKEESNEDDHKRVDNKIEDSAFIADFDDDSNISNQNNDAFTNVGSKDEKSTEDSNKNKKHVNDVILPTDNPIDVSNVVYDRDDRSNTIDHNNSVGTIEVTKDEKLTEESNENEALVNAFGLQEENTLEDFDDKKNSLDQNNAITEEITQDENTTKDSNKTKQNVHIFRHHDIADNDGNRNVIDNNDETDTNEATQNKKSTEGLNKEIKHIEVVRHTEDDTIESQILIVDHDDTSNIMDKNDDVDTNRVRKDGTLTEESNIKEKDVCIVEHTKEETDEASNVMTKFLDQSDIISRNNDADAIVETKDDKSAEAPKVVRNPDQKNERNNKNLPKQKDFDEPDQSSLKNLNNDETEMSTQNAIQLSPEDILLLEGIFNQNDQEHQKLEEGEDIFTLLHEFTDKENSKVYNDIFENIMSITNNLGDDEGNPFALIESNLSNQNEKMTEGQSPKIATAKTKKISPLRTKQQHDLEQIETSTNEEICFEKGKEVINTNFEKKVESIDIDAKQVSYITPILGCNDGERVTQFPTVSERTADQILRSTKENDAKIIAKGEDGIAYKSSDLLHDDMESTNQETISAAMSLVGLISDTGSSKSKEKEADDNVKQGKNIYEREFDQTVENGQRNSAEKIVKIDAVMYEDKDLNNHGKESTHPEKDLSPEKVSSFITALKQYRQSENKKNGMMDFTKKTYQGKIGKKSSEVRKAEPEERKKLNLPEHRERSLQDLRNKGNLSLGSGGSISFNIKKRIITKNKELKEKEISDGNKGDAIFMKEMKSFKSIDNIKISTQNIKLKEENNSTSKGNVSRKKKMFEQTGLVQQGNDEKKEPPVSIRRDLYITTKQTASKQLGTSLKQNTLNEIGNSELKGKVDKGSSINDWFVSPFNTSIDDTTSLGESLKSSFPFTKKSSNTKSKEKASRDEEDPECEFSNRYNYQSTKKYSPSYDFTPILPWQHQDNDEPNKALWKGANRISARNIFIEGKETRKKRLQFIHEAEDNIEIEEISCSTSNTMNSVASPIKHSFEKQDSKIRKNKEKNADLTKSPAKMNSFTKKMSLQTSTIIEETAAGDDNFKNRTNNEKFFGVNNIVKQIEGSKSNNKNTEEVFDLNQLDKRDVEESEYILNHVSSPSSFLTKSWRKEESLQKSRSSQESRKKSISSVEPSGFNLQSTTSKQGKLANDAGRQPIITGKRNNQNNMVKIRSMIALWENDDVHEDKDKIVTAPEETNFQLEQPNKQKVVKELKSAGDEATSKPINYQIPPKRFNKDSHRRQHLSNNDFESKDVSQGHKVAEEVEKTDGNNIYQIQKMRLSPTKQMNSVENSYEVGQSRTRKNEGKPLNSNAVAPHFPFPRTGVSYVSNKGDKIKPPRHPYFSTKNTSSTYTSNEVNSSRNYQIGNESNEESISKIEQKGKLYTEEEVTAAIERAVKLATKQAMLNAALFHGQTSDMDSQSKAPQKSNVSSISISSTSPCKNDDESTGNARKLRNKSQKKANVVIQEKKVSTLRSVFEKNETSLHNKKGNEHTFLKESKSLFRSQEQHNKDDLDNSLVCSSEDDDSEPRNPSFKSPLWKGFDLAKNLLR